MQQLKLHAEFKYSRWLDFVCIVQSHHNDIQAAVLLRQLNVIQATVLLPLMHFKWFT